MSKRFPRGGKNICYYTPIKNGREGSQEARADASGTGGAGKHRSVQSRGNKVK